MTGLGGRTFWPWPATGARFLGGGSSLGSRAALPRLLRRWSNALGRRAEAVPLTTATSPLGLRDLRLRFLLRRRLRVDSSLVEEPETLAESRERFLVAAMSMTSLCAICARRLCLWFSCLRANRSIAEFDGR